MPVVGAEVQRINEAFQQVSLELSAVLGVLRDIDLTTVGTPSVDGAVETGMRDLSTALTGLHQTATDCVSAMSRHGELDPGVSPANSSDSSAVDIGPDTVAMEISPRDDGR